jgi:hypothetical protein
MNVFSFTHSIEISPLLLTTSLPPFFSAFAQEPVIPYTASELPLTATTSNLMYGGHGDRLDIAYPIIRMMPFSQKPRLHFGVDIALR